MGRWISSLIVFVIALAPLCAQNPPAYSGEIVVKLKKGSTQFGPDQLAPLAIDAKVRPVRKVARDARTSSPSVLDGILKFRIAPGHNIRQVCDSLARLEGVLYAEPLFRESLLHQPDDPYAARGGQQSYLALIKAYEAWDVTKGSKEIVLGIIDTGADLEHQDLKGKFLVTRDSLNGLDDDGNGVTDDHMGYDFANNDPYPQADYDPHGTRVSGIAGAMTHNALGIAGVGYHTTLSALKIFTSESNESMGAYDAILYAADNGYDVINLSWGSTGSYSPYAQDVITYAVREKDVVVVAAAGNSSIDEAFYPAAYDDVLSVAATNSDDTKASFSTFHQSVDLVAPGSAIFTTTNGQSYTTGTGTSFAAPMVAGTSALVRARFPSLNARQVMERIRVTTDDISLLAANKTFEGKLGKGRLNAFRAVSDEQLISVRPQLVSVSGPFPEGLYAGDTAEIVIAITNYLDPVINLEVKVVSRNTWASVLSAPATLDYMPSMQSHTLAPQSILISKNTPPATPLELDIEIRQGNVLLERQRVTCYTHADYFNLSNDHMSLSLEGKGGLGYVPDVADSLPGWKWMGNAIAPSLGFLVSTAANHVSDRLPAGMALSTGDFIPAESIRPYRETGYEAAFQAFNQQAGALRIEQDSKLWNNPSLALTYRLVNTGTDTLFRVVAGLMINPDMEEAAQNTLSLDGASSGYVTHPATGKTAGIRLVATPEKHFYPLQTDTSLLVTDSAKYHWLTGIPPDSTVFTGTNDLTLVSSVTWDTLLPHTSKTITFLLAAGKSRPIVEQRLDSALLLFHEAKNKPPLSGTYYSCNGGSVIVKPGGRHLFFSDPFGLDTLAIADSVMIGPLAGDTLIYTARFDSTFAGRLYRTEILRMDDIARFLLPDDTLYLGDIPGNKLTLQDQSLLPVSWKWDFGNGIAASGMPDPAITYDMPGTYQIVLEVQNQQGCTDTSTQTIHVVERPAPPHWPQRGICPGDTAVFLSENDLLFYPFKTAVMPILTGKEIRISSITHDTTLYISQRINQVESRRQSVNIYLNPVDDRFLVEPDMDSLQGNFVRLTALGSAIDSLSWTVGQNWLGNENSISINWTNAADTILYYAKTDSGCRIQQTRVIHAGPSQDPLVDAGTVCKGDTFILRPGNGYYFGVYADSLLQIPLAKGQTFSFPKVEKDTLVYVVALDSLWPGTAVAVSITPITFNFQLTADPPVLYLDKDRAATFSLDRPVQAVEWYRDHRLQSQNPAPVFYFIQEGAYWIVARVTSPEGCVVTDSLLFDVLPTYIPPLGEPMGNPPVFYPNPLKNHLYFSFPEKIKRALLMDLSGKKLEEIHHPGPVWELKSYPTGSYLLLLTDRQGNSGMYQVKVE